MPVEEERLKAGRRHVPWPLSRSHHVQNPPNGLREAIKIQIEDIVLNFL